MESPDAKDKSSKKKLELYDYLNNKERLLPYHKRGISIPELKEGLIYYDMRIQKIELHSNNIANETPQNEVGWYYNAAPVNRRNAAKMPQKDVKRNIHIQI